MAIMPATNEQLLNANDEPLPVQGTVKLKINGIWIKTVVSSAIQDDLLIGWRDLTRLGVIGQDFPM